MEYLTAQQVLFIHHRLVTATGGSHGVRDLGALPAAVARPQATFEGVDLYPDLFAKAATLFESLIRNHPFVDGNKRTAVSAAGLLLRRNGFALAASPEELYAFTMAMATGEASQAEARVWLATHARRT
ncbi:MAG TPA: type II toxin-antitoxin system death-on-curing family toxin [Desulfuromonadales bacterium]|nr:type II toxin-antitoxin system death-on-curing family toxin [Desulfuromonadales bacterium]